MTEMHFVWTLDLIYVYVVAYKWFNKDEDKFIKYVSFDFRDTFQPHWSHLIELLCLLHLLYKQSLQITMSWHRAFQREGAVHDIAPCYD